MFAIKHNENNSNSELKQVNEIIAKDKRRRQRRKPERSNQLAFGCVYIIVHITLYSDIEEARNKQKRFDF